MDAKAAESTEDQYSNRVVALMSAVQEINSLTRLDDDIWRDLVNVLTEAVHDLDADKMSEDSFGSFCAILQIGMEVNERTPRRVDVRELHSGCCFVGY